MRHDINDDHYIFCIVRSFYIMKVDLYWPNSYNLATNQEITPFILELSLICATIINVLKIFGKGRVNMKKAYVKPELNASMNGTLESVYACYDYETSSNKGNNSNWQPYPCQPQPSCGGRVTVYIGW